jgi:U3 small nucleolar RNA-associated protein 23
MDLKLHFSLDYKHKSNFLRLFLRMKIKRHKHVQRCLKFYEVNFNLKQPFNVLIDGTFAHEALKCKLNIAEQMPKYLETDKCKLFTTKCAIKETELLGSATYGAMLILKKFTLHPCNHRDTLNTEKCFRKLIQDKTQSKFFVATQSDTMKETVRSILGTPLLLISHRSINIEKPTQDSVNDANEVLNKKLQPSVNDFEKLKALKQQKGLIPHDEGSHKHRKAKGPNPLSCKKPKHVKRLKNEPKKVNTK